MRCLAEQAKILLAEAEDNNLGLDKLQAAMDRWYTCSLCEQEYHGVVRCALGWACWKTYLGRPERDGARRFAINLLGNGLHAAGYNEDALSAKVAELSQERRLGSPEEGILATQSNLAGIYQALGRHEEAVEITREVYHGWLKLNGEENRFTLLSAINYGTTLVDLRRLEEAKVLMRKVIPVALRVLGENNDTMLRMRSVYAQALYIDASATLDDLREAATTLEEIEQTARRVLGGAHPLTSRIEAALRDAQAALRAHEAGERVVFVQRK